MKYDVVFVFDVLNFICKCDFYWGVKVLEVFIYKVCFDIYYVVIIFFDKVIVVFDFMDYKRVKWFLCIRVKFIGDKINM